MQLFLILALLFSPLAAICAFVITFGEYQHHYPTNKEPLRVAWKTALFTFLIFMTLLLSAGFFLTYFIERGQG